ncbi:MAG: 4-hydroxy 2-oxovalerate aldolase [Solirubrobacteraceae bacterium]|nr:4-hydroxy 2-oxovalerate aldolase [Solirubrobacteraceae bacterium]MEA2394226.1 4-hydroxy 2-oxovalerate aldolase [Solirubrobacteraceae bacterium]
MTRASVRLADTTLRDGSHAVAHQFTEEQVRAVVRGLDRAGVTIIEVSHGDGIGGASFNYGFSHTPELQLIAAAAEEATRATIAVLLIPGLGTVRDLRAARSAGAGMVRIATHCTEADVSLEHFGVARDLGLQAAGFLMLSHMVDGAVLAAQARIMVDAGCECVYVVDSAGALLPEQVQERVAALVDEIGDDAEVGFHGHQNLSLAVANSVVAQRAGAARIDGTLCALGAGAGNTPTEVVAAVFDRLGVATDVDLEAIVEAAETVRGLGLPLPVIDRDNIVMGHAGVYSSFLLHARRAEERYGIPAHRILAECGRRKFVGGQEDMIIDVALTLQAQAA